MTTMHIRYQGNLHTQATHLASNTVIETDAPVDNGGKGESFSPTDLLAASLAACCLTIMAKKAESMGIAFSVQADIEKEMAQTPRRVAAIRIHFHFEHGYDEKTRTILQTAAHHCPVGKSLSADLRQELHFHFPG